MAVAGARRRYLQYVTDFLLMFGIAAMTAIVVTLAAVPLVKWGAPPQLILWSPFIALAAGALIADLCFHVVLPYKRGGATPGMRMLGLRVVTMRGGEPSLGAYFVRWLLFAVDGLVFGLVGAILIARTPQRQRLGDLVARTTVVHRQDGPRHDTVPRA
jgi:uncharacterized RDD family membrane protein YckC